MPEFIFRENHTPVMVGRLPSQKEGRLVDVRFDATDEGVLVASPYDRGAVRDFDDNHFYLFIGGVGEIPFKEGELRECVEEMQETRRKKEAQRAEQPADWATIQQALADMRDAYDDLKVGRKRFSV